MPDRRRRICVAVILCLLLLAALPAAATEVEEYESAITALRCDCGCHPQSVKDCACGRAAQMREEIAGLVEGHGGRPPMSGADIISDYVAKHGDQILISPTAVGFNLLAWLGPIVGLIVGLVLAVFVVRRLSASASVPLPATVGVTPPPSDDDSAYREKLRRQLAEWK